MLIFELFQSSTSQLQSLFPSCFTEDIGPILWVLNRCFVLRYARLTNQWLGKALWVVDVIHTKATFDAKGAEAAYLLAADRVNNGHDAGQRVLALARLALLDRREGHVESAATREALLDRLWSGADPGLRAAVKRMR